MKLPLSQPHFCSFLLLVVSNFLLWEKAASVPACLKDPHCMEPLVATFNNALERVVTIINLTEQMHQEFSSQLIRQDHLGPQARTYCHSTVTNPPNIGPQHAHIPNKSYLKMLINFVGAWISPLNHLVLELRAMQNVPETIISKAYDIEKKNRLLLDDLKWIFTKVYPNEKLEEMFPRWQYIFSIESNDKEYQLLAIYNLSHCLSMDIFYTEFHLKTLRCRITKEGCC
ncbi:prolactin-8A9-like [Arvicanthis niloticus]|uniref:prolactin-8A9-like n=1 Tax=Arvicanthis niloticus TaxID=61156 RepID=UPI0014871C4E|nr:prolactin-8A9-like [Arvicanthis niloticus]